MFQNLFLNYKIIQFNQINKILIILFNELKKKKIK